jgi:plasmid stabilization system protein ParE
VREPLFHPEAMAEYIESVGWYEERSLRAAERFEAEVERVLARILADPNAFPRYDEIHRFAVLHRFPYSVVYEAQAEGVYVIAVAHSSRSPGYWQTRR